MSLLTRLERIFGRFSIPNLALYIIGGQAIFLGLALLARFDLHRILLVPALVLQGEIWRPFTFVLLPPVAGQLDMLGALFLALSWYFYHFISQVLESHWGTFRFNLFFLLGWFLTVAFAFFNPEYPTGYAFFAVSVFLAFAFLHPDFELYILFILPVKIRWMALLMWLGFAYSFVTGSWNTRFAVLAATGNFLIFFSREIVERIKTGRRHMKQQARRTSFREHEGEPRHRCAVCGKTDITHPMEEFRYGDDDQCYCSEHRPGAAKSK